MFGNDAFPVHRCASLDAASEVVEYLFAIGLADQLPGGSADGQEAWDGEMQSPFAVLRSLVEHNVKSLFALAFGGNVFDFNFVWLFEAFVCIVKQVA